MGFCTLITTYLLFCSGRFIWAVGTLSTFQAFLCGTSSFRRLRPLIVWVFETARGLRFRDTTKHL